MGLEQFIDVDRLVSLLNQRQADQPFTPEHASILEREGQRQREAERFDPNYAPGRENCAVVLYPPTDGTYKGKPEVVADARPAER